MNWSYLRLAPLVIFLLLMLGVSTGLFMPREMKDRNSAMLGQRLPEFSLPQVANPGQLFLSSQWKGQVAVVNIFASWCVPCKAEHPVLLQLAAAPGVSLYGLAWKDSAQNISQYLAANGNPFRNVGMDPVGTTTLIFGIEGVPETYVIDKKGLVRHKHAGPLTDEVARQTILPLVQKLNAEP